MPRSEIQIVPCQMWRIVPYIHKVNSSCLNFPRTLLMVDEYMEKLQKAKKLDLFQTEILLLFSDEIRGLLHLQGMESKELDNQLHGIVHSFLMMVTDLRDFNRLYRFCDLLLRYREIFMADKYLYGIIVEMYADPDCPSGLKEKLKFIIPKIEPSSQKMYMGT